MLPSTFDVNWETMQEWIILDSGASSYFLCLDAAATNKEIAENTCIVLQPDGDSIVSIH